MEPTNAEELKKRVGTVMIFAVHFLTTSDVTGAPQIHPSSQPVLLPKASNSARHWQHLMVFFGVCVVAHRVTAEVRWACHSQLVTFGHVIGNPSASCLNALDEHDFSIYRVDVVKRHILK